MFFSLSSCSLFLGLMLADDRPDREYRESSEARKPTESRKPVAQSQDRRPVNRPDRQSNTEFTKFQRLVLEEVNFARTNPKRYAETRLKDAYLKGKDNGAYYDIKRWEPVHALTLEAHLCSAAEKYAKYLAVNNLSGHYADGTPRSRCEAAGYTDWTSIGENIAYGYGSGQNANVDEQKSAIVFVRQLIIDRNVPDLGHRKNIMRDSYTQIGVGYYYYQNSRMKNYLVQDFGRQ